MINKHEFETNLGFKLTQTSKHHPDLMTVWMLADYVKPSNGTVSIAEGEVIRSTCEVHDEQYPTKSIGWSVLIPDKPISLTYTSYYFKPTWLRDVFVQAVHTPCKIPDLVTIITNYCKGGDRTNSVVVISALNRIIHDVFLDIIDDSLDADLLALLELYIDDAVQLNPLGITTIETYEVFTDTIDVSILSGWSYLVALMNITRTLA